MHRLILRLSAVGAVLGVGILAIVQAHFRTNRHDALAGQPAPAVLERTVAEAPQPIPVAPGDSESPLVAPEPSSFRLRTSSPRRDAVDQPPAQPPQQTLQQPATRFVDRQPDAARPETNAPATDPHSQHDAPGSIRRVAGEVPADDQYAGGYAPSSDSANPPADGYSPADSGYRPDSPGYGPPDSGYGPPDSGYGPPDSGYIPDGAASASDAGSGVSAASVGVPPANSSGYDPDPVQPPATGDYDLAGGSGYLPAGGPAMSAGDGAGELAAPPSTPPGATLEPVDAAQQSTLPPSPEAYGVGGVSGAGAGGGAILSDSSGYQPGTAGTAGYGSAEAPGQLPAEASQATPGDATGQGGAYDTPGDALPASPGVAADGGTADSIAAEGVAPGYGGPANVAQENVAQENVAPEYAAPGNAAPGNAAPGNVAPEGVAPYGVAADAAGATGEGQGQPGDRRLEGLQTPSLTIEKRAPAEIQVNRPAQFSIRVRNASQTVARQVIVTDQIPAGTRLIRTTPEAALGADGSVTWQLGTLPPGQEATINLELLPLREGEIGSVAQVSFQAQASVRTVCTQPKLKLTQAVEPTILAGERLAIRISLTNEGSGAATGVVIEEDVPDGLLHAAGRELEYEVGTLAPGQTRNLELTLTAQTPGPVRNRLVARADGDVLVEHTVELTVVAPQLKLAVEGPRMRYLERQATYTIGLANQGTAPARDVELAAQLPPGFKFVATNNHGRYDPQTHAVLWSLAELPPGVEGSVELKVLPDKMGEHTLRVEGRGAGNLSDRAELPVTVEGLAALFFQVGDSADPIPAGNETTYEVRVTNTGSKAATNVRIVATLPAGMLPLSGQGPTRVLVEGQQMASEPIARLEPRADAVFKFLARGVEQGDQRVRIQLVSDELDAPVLKEESTLVYADR